MKDFVVTANAMRPNSESRRCFYCHRDVGGFHKPDCVLVKKKVRVRMTIEYDIEMPASWGKDKIEFSRNMGTWCASNALPELEALSRANNDCLCNMMHFDYIKDSSEAYLDEN